MTDTNLLNDELSLVNIFHPRAMERLRKVRERNTLLVHYTTADAAMKILDSEQVWMRKISCMNDYMEVKQGLECLSQAYDGAAGEQLKKALNDMFPGFTAELEHLFNEWIPYFHNTTYIACLSEHSNDEDPHGRLSMWRAYGHSTGVALVLNNTPFLAYHGPPGVYSSPVLYLDDLSFEHELQEVVGKIRQNFDFVRNQGRDAVRSATFNAFKFAVLCTKHPGFREEREWRAIYMPSMEQSQNVETSIETVNGTPQPICKFRLKNSPDIGVTGLEVPELLNQVIIGPSKYPDAIYEAFVTRLAQTGMKDAASRVRVTSIPLRL